MPVALGGLAVADILTFLAFLVCLGMNTAWRHTIGRGLIALADELDKAAIDLPWPIGTRHIFGPVSSAIRWTEGVTAHWLAEAALATEHAAIFLWDHTVSIVEESAKWVVESALAPLFFADWLLREFFPGFRAAVISHVKGLIRNSEVDTRKAVSEVRQFAAHEIHRVEAVTEHEINHIDHVITADVFPRIRTAEHDIGALRAKLEKITSSLSKDAIVALIGATIWKELFGGIRCPSWLNLTRNRGCFAWSGLESLLGLLVDLVILENICDVLPLLETAVSDVAVPMVVGLTDVGAGLCDKKHTAPAKLTGPATVPVPVYFTGDLVLP